MASCWRAARELGTIRPQQRVRASQIVVKHRTGVFVETDLATFLRANCLVPQAAAQSRLCGKPASQRPPSVLAGTLRRREERAQLHKLREAIGIGLLDHLLANRRNS
jgi:hypothetical protein